MKSSLLNILFLIVPCVFAAGYRLVGSSGCTPQMVFIPPHTDTAVFIDNYHENYGGPGFDIQTGKHSSTPYRYPGTNIPVFSTEYDLKTNTFRALKPLSNTFCSAGAFFPNGTLVNMAGAEPGKSVGEGFDKVRTYTPGLCDGKGCSGDWTEQAKGLQVYRWYPSAQTMVDGSVLVVGGSKVGGLVLNEASINVPTYEIIHKDGRTPAAPVILPILEFTAEENLNGNKSYNLYPIMHLLPNPGIQNHMFTLAGNRAVVWDYGTNILIKTLPDAPLQPRTFPSVATSVLLPLKYPDFSPRVLVCGGASTDIPNPITLRDCYTINPSDLSPVWVRDDDLPNGPQTMSDGLNLPDGTILLINGARHGSAGGFQADDPVLVPLIYTPSAALGSRFTSLPATTIPRLYHSTAILLPSGEVLVAGSNPAVSYTLSGVVAKGWPRFKQNGHQAAINQQQYQNSSYPTEYRVEIFSPPYMDAPASAKPNITWSPTSTTYGATFQVEVRKGGNKRLRTATSFALVAGGFHTHGLGMGQRMINLGFTVTSNSFLFTVRAPRDASVIPPGQYMLFAVSDGIPSVAVWIDLA